MYSKKTLERLANETAYDHSFTEAVNAVIDSWKKCESKKKTDAELAQLLGVAVVTVRKWKSGERKPSGPVRTFFIEWALKKEMYYYAEILQSEDIRSPADKDDDFVNSSRRRYGLYPTIKTDASPDLDLFNYTKRNFDFEKTFNPFYVTKRDLWDKCGPWMESVLQRTFSAMDYERDPYLKDLPKDAKYYCETDGRFYLLGSRDLVKLKKYEDDLKEYASYLMYKKREEDSRLFDFLWRLSNKYPHFTDASNFYDPDDYKPIIPDQEEIEVEVIGSKDHRTIKTKLEPIYPKKPTEEEKRRKEEYRAEVYRIDRILMDLENGGDMWKEEYKRMLEEEAKEDGKR
ncbi:MAG: hypothetical protein K6D92_04475 [Erysipelotrichaceae bacterium]|nr:hypothetical protein [Erysipelotrichaceae bacterium]